MIHFIYFDLGGVVIDDFSGNTKWDDLKKELGINANNEPRFNRLWATYSPQLCTTLDSEELLAILKKELNLDLPAVYSLLTGFVKRFTPNPFIQLVLEEAKKHARIGLLTNVYIGMFDAIKESGILPNTNWDIVLDSSIEGLEKPDPRFFELAAQRANTPPEEILFIDNTQGHLDAAEKLGWKTYFYDASDHRTSSQQLLDYFATIQL